MGGAEGGEGWGRLGRGATPPKNTPNRGQGEEGGEGWNSPFFGLDLLWFLLRFGANLPSEGRV